MGGVDPPGWRPAGGQWNKKQASLCRLANCCSRFSAGPLAAGVTSGFQALVGNRLLLAVDFETAVFHDKESIVGNFPLLWALDGEADALDHTGMPQILYLSLGWGNQDFSPDARADSSLPPPPQTKPHTSSRYSTHRAHTQTC